MLAVREQSAPSGAYHRQVPFNVYHSILRGTYIQIGGLHVDFLVILIYVTRAHDLT